MDKATLDVVFAEITRILGQPHTSSEECDVLLRLKQNLEDIHQRQSWWYGEKERYTDVHTEHCCKLCGCKYGEDVAEEGPFDSEPFISCSVVSGRYKQSRECKGHCGG